MTIKELKAVVDESGTLTAQVPNNTPPGEYIIVDLKKVNAV